MPSPALLLARTPYGETSLVATVLAPAHGRVRLLAKGAYRQSSRFFGVLDAFHTLELDWRAPKDPDGLALLAKGDWSERRVDIPRFGASYRAAWVVLETARLVARDGMGEPRLFGLARATLAALDAAAAAGDETAARLARVAFDLAALHNLGLAPALGHCASCGRPAPAATDRRQTTFFGAVDGGRLCRACASARGDGRAGANGRARRGSFAPSSDLDAAAAPSRVPSHLLETAASLLAGGPAPAGGAPANLRRDLPALERLVDRFTAHHLDANRKSLAGPTA